MKKPVGHQFSAGSPKDARTASLEKQRESTLLKAGHLSGKMAPWLKTAIFPIFAMASGLSMPSGIMNLLSFYHPAALPPPLPAAERNYISFFGVFWYIQDCSILVACLFLWVVLSRSLKILLDP